MKIRTQTLNLLTLIEARGVPKTPELKRLFKNTLVSMYLKAMEAEDKELVERIDKMLEKLKS